MSAKHHNLEVELPEVANAILDPEFVRAVFSGPIRSKQPGWQRVTIKPLLLRGVRRLQFIYFDGKKTITEHPEHPELAVQSLLDVRYAGVHVETATQTLDLQCTKKGKIIIGRSRNSSNETNGLQIATGHNRVKEQPYREDQSHPVLQVLGIAKSDGGIKPTMRAKFTQINEFLRHLEFCLHATELNSLGRPLRVLDCGCGLSYLTIAAHDYLNRVLQIPAELIGVDLNEAVIRKSVERKSQLNAVELNFACERIGRAEIAADVVLALHACNTATDDALAQAIHSQAKVILCAPCCHHDVNAQLKQANRDSPTAWRAVLRHGILRERLADLLTDSLRAAMLRMYGYRAEVIEFVSPEHSARNLMIRAVYTGHVPSSADEEFLALRDYWGIESALEARLTRRENDSALP